MILGSSSFTYGWSTGILEKMSLIPMNEIDLLYPGLNFRLYCLQIGRQLQGHIDVAVEQMALLEPGLAEVSLGAVMFTTPEFIAELVKNGMPKDAVFDFYGHIYINLALCFDRIPGRVFSDAS